MATASSEKDDDQVQCKLCTNHVWIRRDRLENHIRRVHAATAAPRKSFTTYKARIASNFPPRLAQPDAIKQAGKINPGVAEAGNVRLISRKGRRAGSGRCAECGREVSVTWQYAESNQGAVGICAECKTRIFERSF